MAAACKLLPWLQQRTLGPRGRLRGFFLARVLGIALLFLISSYHGSALAVVALCAVRNALMNGTAPLLQSVVLDCVPSKARGRWSAIASFQAASWCAGRQR